MQTHSQHRLQRIQEHIRVAAAGPGAGAPSRSTEQSTTSTAAASGDCGRGSGLALSNGVAMPAVGFGTGFWSGQRAPDGTAVERRV
jgi:hypothetical protein